MANFAGTFTSLKIPRKQQLCGNYPQTSHPPCNVLESMVGGFSTICADARGTLNLCRKGEGHRGELEVQLLSHQGQETPGLICGHGSLKEEEPEPRAMNLTQSDSQQGSDNLSTHKSCCFNYTMESSTSQLVFILITKVLL